jgi:hypothetical protein
MLAFITGLLAVRYGETGGQGSYFMREPQLNSILWGGVGLCQGGEEGGEDHGQVLIQL